MDESRKGDRFLLNDFLYPHQKQPIKVINFELIFLILKNLNFETFIKNNANIYKLKSNFKISCHDLRLNIKSYNVKNTLQKKFDVRRVVRALLYQGRTKF